MSIVPKRVRLRGDLYHPVAPEGAVDITRNGPWGNPFRVKVFGLEGALAQYRQYLQQRSHLVEKARRELAGKDLACWCPLGAPCHGDILLAVVNGVDP